MNDSEQRHREPEAPRGTPAEGGMPTRSTAFRLGPWVVDPELNRLYHDSLRRNPDPLRRNPDPLRRNPDPLQRGVSHDLDCADLQPRSMEPRLMQLLCLLAAKPGRLVERDDLIEALWPRVVVNENSLTRAVSELRKQLRVNAADKTRYVETIPKRGYRLLAEQVSFDCDRLAARTSGETGAPVKLHQHGSGARRTENRGLWLHAAASSLKAAPVHTAVTLSLVLALTLSVTLSPGQQQSTFPTPALIAGGLPAAGSVSEGNSLQAEPIVLRDEFSPGFAGLMDESDGGTLRATGMDSNGGPTPDPSLDGVVYSTPVLSHDGRYYAFLRRDIDGSALLLGRTDDMLEPVVIHRESDRMTNLTWSPAGKALLFSREPIMQPSLMDEQRPEGEVMHLDIRSGKLSRLAPSAERERPGSGSKEPALT